VASLAVLAGGAASAQDRFGLSPDPDAVVARYLEHIGGIADDDPGPSVTVFASGRLLVHVPDYRSGAGDFEAFLNPGELRQLVRDLVRQNLVEFDPQAARRDKRRSEELSAEISEIADASTIEVTLNLDEYSPRGPSAQVRRDVRKQVRWYGLRHDADRHPNVASLQDLAGAAGILAALMERSDLRPVAAE
jgi:hypothetical protein